MQHLLTLSQYVEENLKRIQFPEKPENLYEPLRYFLALGGKRIRPIATLAAAEAFDVRKENSISTALAIEVFHNFTLIHDDIMDNAPLRRGKQTVHEKWNTNIGILSGDVLFVEAYKLLSRAPSNVLPELINLFNKTSIEVCEGQQMDMDFESRSDVFVEEYLKMIELKTSVLLACAFEMGGILGNASNEDRFHLYQFGLNLGLAFQIQDDYLDAFGDPEMVGKQPGGDILADKKTFLSLSLRENLMLLSDNELNALKYPANNETKVQQTINLLKKLGIDEKAIALKEDFEKKATKHLTALSCANKKTFMDIQDFLANRKH